MYNNHDTTGKRGGRWVAYAMMRRQMAVNESFLRMFATPRSPPPPMPPAPPVDPSSTEEFDILLLLIIRGQAADCHAFIAGEASGGKTIR